MNPINNYNAVRIIELCDELLDIMPLRDGEMGETRPLHIDVLRAVIQYWRDTLKEDLYGHR